MIVYGTRTHHTTGEEKTVELFVELRYSKSLGTWWLYIIKGGVTGYESISVDALMKQDGDGWFACAGTKGRWDTLFITERWMDIIRAQYKDDIEEINKAS